MSEEKRGPGRPTLYKPEFCDQVVEFGAEGMGMAEIALELGVCRDTVHEWTRVHPEFSDAITRAKQASAGWWEKQGRKGIWSKDFNANAYRLQVMNRFPADWRDKREHEHASPGGGPVEVVYRVVDPKEPDEDA